MCASSPASVIYGQLLSLLFDVPQVSAVLFSDEDRVGTEFVEGFIRRFIDDNDVSRVARSVSIVQELDQNEPHNFLPKICARPRKQNVDAPKMCPLEKASTGFRIDVHECDLYVFQNDASVKELQLFAITVRGVPTTSENDIVDLFVMTLTTA